MIIGSKIISFENLTSTNTYAIALLKTGPQPEGTIIFTNYQSGGKGQKGNRWESEPGKNLLFSIILYPATINPLNQFIISKVLSLGICDFLEAYTGKVCIKWPNDIYSGDDKIAGILIENSLMNGKIEYTVAGIGLNINQEIFKSDAPNPVSLSLLTGRTYNLADCMNKVIDNLDMRYKLLIENDFITIDSDYISKLYRYREWHKYRVMNNIFKGRIVSVTPAGLLQIEEENGTLRDYSFKEVDFIR